MKRLFLALLALAAPLHAQTAKPNIVLILADDLGPNDLSCYGRKDHATPNLDKLATQGMRFTSAYAAQPICSPSRAALLTGKCPARLHLTNFLPGRADAPTQKLLQPVIEGQLPLEEFTVAELLKAAGYTTACIGKWHLGGAGFGPKEQGFDVVFAGEAKTTPTAEEGSKGEIGLTVEAEKFMEANKDKPFFLYLPHYAVHTPIAGKPEVVDKFKAKVQADPTLKQRNATYAALVSSVDDALGTIRANLRRLKLEENTVIFFTGDNGGLLPITENSPYRAGKGSAYEGGVRVPFIAYWPGVTKAGVVEATPAITLDLYPTVLEMTGVKPLASVVDGRSLAPVLRGGKIDRDTLYWHYPHYHPGGATPYSAIRKGDFRLVHFYEDNRDELYDLSQDIGETKDLASTQATRAKAMREQLDAWLKSVDAQLPTSNPDFDPNAGKAKGGEGKKKAAK